MAGDGVRSTTSSTLGLFQSTPTNFMAGDPLQGPPWRAGVGVSIHAHQFHGGRPGSDHAGPLLHPRFNPRPPISWRATPRRRPGLSADPVSIHAHQFHGGRQADLVDALQRHRVSIHAHQFHGGRPGWRRCRWTGGPVSIHAHQFHGGRPSPAIPTGRSRGFNPRPPISWRATAARFRPWPSCSGFNPRPPISWRATSAIPGSQT